MGAIKVWTQQEEEKLYREASNPRGESRANVFRRLAKELGRSKKSLELKFYKELRADNPSLQNAIVRETHNNKSGVKKEQMLYNGKEKFTWTTEKMNKLKEEILKSIKDKNPSFDALYDRLSNHFGYSKGTIFNKMQTFKTITNSQTIEELYNGIVSGVSVDVLNNLPSSYGRKSKKKRKARIVSQTTTMPEIKQPEQQVVVEKPKVVVEKSKPKQVIKQEVIKKLSFWQKINPFYRIKKLEQEIVRLKSKMD